MASRLPDTSGLNGTSSPLGQRTLVRGPALERPPGYLGQLGKAMRVWGYALDLYNWRLSGRHPLKVDRVIEDVRKGDPAKGDALINSILDGRAEAEQAKLFWSGTLDGFDPDHSFSFLIDLAAAREQLAARAVATALTDAWCDRYLAWHKDAWNAASCAHRLLTWLANIPLLLASSDLVYRSRVLLAVARQMRHLPRVIKDIERIPDQVKAGAALALAGLILPGASAEKDKGFKALSNLINKAILPDGTPATQSLSDLLDMLYTLGLVRIAAEKAQKVFPNALQSALDRAGPFLRSLYHSGDYKSQIMGGCDLSRGEALMLLDRLGATGSAGSSFPHGGVYRLEASGTVLLATTAPAPKGALSKGLAADTGAFELSSSGDLLITAMGMSTLPSLRQATRATAAHSALVLDNRHVTEILSNGHLGAGVERATSKRRARRDGEEVTLVHDGYAKRLGISHTRKWHLSRDGLVITGTDIVTAIRKRPALCPLDLWFHVPPLVAVKLSKDGTVLLTTSSRKIWVLTVDGASASLEASLFCHNAGEALATKAIRLHKEAFSPPKTVVNWAITRKE